LLYESVGNFVFGAIQLDAFEERGKEKGMATNKEIGITDEVLDQLLAGRDAATVFETLTAAGAPAQMAVSSCLTQLLRSLTTGSDTKFLTTPAI
jgi:hypothetical protein